MLGTSPSSFNSIASKTFNSYALGYRYLVTHRILILPSASRCISVLVAVSVLLAASRTSGSFTTCNLRTLVMPVGRFA